MWPTPPVLPRPEPIPRPERLPVGFEPSAGEIVFNSIDRDGTGNGLDYEILNKIPNTFKRPIIISGGTGNYQHVLEGFKKNNFNAISTANLLNFIGDGLTKMRNKLIENKINFPLWDYTKL